MREIKFDAAAFRDYREWMRTNPKITSRINELMEDILREPFKGIGKPEALKHNWQGYWSRRITEEHRLVYKVKQIPSLLHLASFITLEPDVWLREQDYKS